MEMTMKKTAISLSLAALVLGSGAYAAPGAPSPALKRDSDSNGVVTRAEAQRAAASIFTQMDVNKDGTFDRADRAARREAMQARMFDRLDANKDGQITRAEFMTDKGARRAGPRGGFRADRRGPGELNANPGGAAASPGLAAAMTQDQFVAAALQRFDARDANKDGQLTQAERQAAREQRKARRQQSRTPQAQG
jgi:hypothetical protein